MTHGIQNNIETNSTDPKTGLQLSDREANSYDGSDTIQTSSISDNIPRDSIPGITEESRHKIGFRSNGIQHNIETDPKTGLQFSGATDDIHGGLDMETSKFHI